MFERMASQCSVVYLDVHFEIFFQTVSFEEADNRFRIYIVLMFGRFHRFRFDQERTFETTGTGIVASQRQHLCQVFFFSLLIRVQQRHITFATAPEYIVLSAEFDRSVDSVFDLYGSTGNYIEIGVGSRTVHITCMAEYVGSTPQQFDTGFSLFLFGISDDLFQIGFIFLDRSSFVAKVYIVEAIVFDTHFLHEFETCIHFIFSSFYGCCSVIPRERFGRTAELVATLCAQSVPPSHGEFQPVFHFFAQYLFFRIVVTVSHRVFTLFTFEFNFSYTGKIFFLFHNDIYLKD